MEFEDHRPLYDWLLDELEVYHPQQIEFARLNLSHTKMSKRKLLEMVKEGHVTGWDDPRMPTLSGMRRRGYTPESIRSFCERVGVAKRQNTVDIALLEHSVREDLNRKSPRVMGVLRPLRVVIENYPEDQVEELDAVNNPEDPAAGTRELPFFARAVYRARGLPRGPTEKVLSPESRPRSEAALRLLHHVRRCRQGPSDGRGHRAALHLRSRDTRGSGPRRAPGQGDDTLGSRPATRSKPMSASTTTCSRPRSPTRWKRAPTTGAT